MKKYSLSAIGIDQPGIVAALTEPLFKRGCNIEDSSMTILEDEFAVILIMSRPDEAESAALWEDIKKVEKSFSLTIDIREITSKAEGATKTLSNYILTLHGEDSSGLIYKTAHLLADEGINITDLETKTAQREAGEGENKDSGKKLYMMMMELFISHEADLEALKSKLASLGEELGVSISLKPIEDFGRL